MRIRIANDQKNSTPCVVRALAAIKAAGGGELHFEKGEYHFYKDGTEKGFFAISNNSACDKYMVFPIIGMENVLVDGHGSLFVFHEIVFPFMVSKSKNVVLKDFTVDTGMSPLVHFNLHDLSDDGFYMDIDREKSPFFVENGSLCFERENGIWEGKKHLISLHAIGRHKVQYLATGNNEVNTENLPAPHIKCDALEAPHGIYVKYRDDTPYKCQFGEEMLSAIIDGGRAVDVICLDRSEQIEICRVCVARGIGMGVIGQLSTNVRIDAFSTDPTYHGYGHQTLSADALHFVNCDGVLEIKNCKISNTMDDALNVHGIYTVLSGVADGGICARIMHREQHFFNPYREGDRLTLIDNVTLEVVAELIVRSCTLGRESGSELFIQCDFIYGREKVKEGFLIENPIRMPDLHMHHNEFSAFPHNRISGAGKIVVEDNHFKDCHAALLCLDLARYWYESGRVKHLIYRNNVMENCDISKKGAFIVIGVDGIADDKAPKIHERIEITQNTFRSISQTAVKAGGVQELILENNSFDSQSENLLRIF